MRVYHLECELLVRRSMREVFSVFENARNLAKITPPWLNFEVITKEEIPMRSGAEIDYKIRLFGVPMHWKSRITDYEPPFKFVDRQVIGPYKLWNHTHTFRPVAEGVMVSDNVDYQLPLDPFSRIANAVMVRHQLLAIFRFRQKALRDIFFGGEASPVAEPSIVVKGS